MEDQLQERLEGKVAIITGTGDGMGRTAALRFCAEGARVVGCDINEETAAETLRLVRETGGEMECLYPIDLSSEAATHRLMTFAVERYGGIDILYNNAYAQKLGAPEHMTLEDFNFTITNTLTISWLAAKHAIPHLRRRGGGAIIFISSASGQNFGSGFPGNSPILFSYAAAKAGINRLATCLAVELAQHGIRVNTVSPAWISTPITMNLAQEEGAEPYKVATDTLLVDRLGRPEDIVEAALFLCTPQAGYIHGANLIVDGGQTACGGVGGPDPRVAQVLQSVAGEWVSVDDEWTSSGVGS
jgi:NAD(P)-dependent dehydrogenase (short-subunit alcohol dehydrogenase family)